MGMTTIEGQTVRRRRLRSELRRVRETASLTQDQVATAMDWSLSKVIRIENGAVGISTNDLKALLDLYGVTERKRIDDLVGLAQSARQRARAWWSGYRSAISPQYLTYLGYEAEATAIRQFHPAVVPALLQTEAYMRAVLRDTPLTPMAPEAIETLVKVRLSRQHHVLEQRTPPEILTILDESVVRRVVGRPHEMRDQLRHLLQLAKQPGFGIQVLRFSAGASPGVNGPFAILEFPDVRETDVVALDGGPGVVFLHEDEEAVIRYREVFSRLLELALSPRDSLDLIREVAAQI
jgi:transcriptional regulator with XRE-family HTH domain